MGGQYRGRSGGAGSKAPQSGAWSDPTALAPMLSEERRRRAEAVLCQDLDDVQRMLLPVALALARLAARRAVAADASENVSALM